MNLSFNSAKPMDGLRFVIASFAVYRLSRMVALERGPLEVFEKLRGAILNRFGAEHWVFDGITCPLCLSVWLALVVALLWWYGYGLDGLTAILIWFGMSGMATFLYKLERE